MGNIKTILDMYNDKEVLAKELYSIEADIIKYRSQEYIGYSDKMFDAIDYNVSSNIDESSDRLAVATHHALSNKSYTKTNEYVVEVNNIIKELKSILKDSKEEEYVSLALSYIEPNGTYEFTLEVNGKASDDMGNFIVVNMYYKKNDDIMKLIEYTTNITDYNKLYGDETAVIKLNKDCPMITIAD